MGELAHPARRRRGLARARPARGGRATAARGRHGRVRGRRRARVRGGASHPDRAAGGRQPPRAHRARLPPLDPGVLSGLSRGGSRARGRSSVADGYRRADRAAPDPAPPSARGARELGLPRGRWARAPRLWRKPGLARDQPRRRRLGPFRHPGRSVRHLDDRPRELLRVRLARRWTRARARVPLADRGGVCGG